MEKEAERTLKEIIESSIAKTQEEFNVDVFGFGEAIHRSNPDYWKKVKKEWDEKFTNMPIEVKIDIKLRRTGTIGNSPLENIKE